MSAALPPVAVLAGGLATRLGALTTDLPKSLVPIAGEPFIAHQLRLLRRRGASSVVLCVGHLADPIRDFVGNGQRFGLDVRYSFDGNRLLGTGGALRNALPFLGETFFVTYGDSYLDIAYEPLLERLDESRATGVMTVFRNQNRWERSNVEFREGWVRRYQKKHQDSLMLHIDFGLTALRATAFDTWRRRDVFDLADLLSQLSANGQLAGHEAEERFYEIGSTSGFAETERHLRNQTA